MLTSQLRVDSKEGRTIPRFLGHEVSVNYHPEVISPRWNRVSGHEAQKKR